MIPEFVTATLVATLLSATNPALPPRGQHRPRGVPYCHPTWIVIDIRFHPPRAYVETKNCSPTARRRNPATEATEATDQTPQKG